MPGIDQILSFIIQQGADELRLGTDEEPQTFSKGVRRHFTMSRTPDAVLRQLLGEILSPEREAQLANQLRLCFDYPSHSAGPFQVTLQTRSAGGMDVTFTQSAAGSRAFGHVPATLGHVSSPSQPKPSSVDKASAEATTTSRGNTAALRAIVEEACRLHASDIHLVDGEPAYLRVDGRLQLFDGDRAVNIDEYLQLNTELRQKLASGGSVEFALDLESNVRLRVTVYENHTGTAVAIRLLPSTAPALADLLLPVPIADLAELPNGLVLFCGATGSGKSTTLAALSRHALLHRSILLVSLEDPIEFRLSSSAHSIVRQRQIGRDVVDFTTGLRDALRSDPDVIVVGELRDAETIRLSLTAAETGHLVLASIHGGSAASCVERVIDAYPADQRSQVRVQLADVLRAVVVQRLLPRVRTAGRVAALEVLRVNRAVANVIREGKTAQLGTLIQGGKRDGMISLERCLADYLSSGAISAEVARAAANDVDTLNMYLAK